MTYPPSSSGYPSAPAADTQFSAPTQQFGKVEQPQPRSSPGRRRSEQAAVVPARRGRGARPGRVPVQLRADVHDRAAPTSRSWAAPPARRWVSGSPSSRRCSPGCSPRRACCPSRRLPSASSRRCPCWRFLLVIAEIIRQAGRRQHRLGALRRHRADVPAGSAARSAPCCSTRASSRRPRRSRSTSSRSTASTAARASTTVSTHAPGSARRQQQRPAVSVASTAAATRVGPSTGGYAAVGQQSGPPTPPTGFPTYGQPQASPSAPTRPGSGAAAVVVIVVRHQSGNSPS